MIAGNQRHNFRRIFQATGIIIMIGLYFVFSAHSVHAHVVSNDSARIVALIDSAKVHAFELDRAINDLDSAMLLSKFLHAKMLMADVLMEEGDVFTKNSLLEKADSVFLMAKNIMDSLPKNEKYLELIRRQAVCAYFEGNYQKVLQLARKGLDEAHEQNNQSFTATFFNIHGVAYSGMGDQGASLRYYLKALDIFNSLNKPDKIASVESNIGTIYQSQGNVDAAETYYRKALYLAEKINDKQIISTALSNLGDIAAGRKQYKKALDYFLYALKLSRQIKDDFGIAMILNNIGDSYLNLHDAENAHAYFDSANVLAKKIGDNATYSLSMISLAEYYSKEKHNRLLAIAYAEKALNVSRQGNNVDNLMNALDLLNRLYAENGNYKKAYAYLTQYEQIHDSLFSKEKNLQLVKAQKEYEFRVKDREMALIKQKKETTQAYLVVSVLALLFVTGFFLFFIRLRVVRNKALKKQKRFVDNLLEESETHVLVLDKDANNLYLSPSYERHFGHKIEEREGKSSFEYVHPDDLPELKGLLKELQSGKIVRKEFSFRLKNQKGEYRDVRGIVKSMLNNPEFQGFILNFWDVTDTRKAEKALAESERKYRQIFNTISDIYFRLDRQGKITEISPSVKAITGYEPGEVIGKSADDFMEFAVGWDKAGRIFSRWGRIDDFDIMIKTKKGDKIHCSLNAHTITNGDDKHEGYEGTLRDISQRVQIEQELKKANASKDKILSIIGHDLMGPIGTQKAILDMISDEIDEFSKEEMAQLLKTMRPSMDATFTMIENLLSWARIMRKNILPHLSDNELYPIVAKVFELLKQQARKKNIQLVYEGKEDFHCVFDKNLMEIVIRNLLSNAIKFSQPGDKVIVRAEITDGYCMISVSDQGIGMTDEDIRKVFSETEKLESKAGTNREKGTGLGLIIVKEFIQKNNGKLQIKSEKGKGTTFTFTLPKA